MALCASCMTMSLGKDVMVAAGHIHVSLWINMTAICPRDYILLKGIKRW